MTVDSDNGGASAAIQWLDGKCPACGVSKVLFLTEDDAGRYVTCSLIGCPDPLLADQMAALAGEGPAVEALHVGRSTDV